MNVINGNLEKNSLTENNKEKSILICKNCKTENRIDANFCVFCGKSLVIENKIEELDDCNKINITQEILDFERPSLDFFYSPNEFAYAKCDKQNDKGFVFKCIDNYSYFYLPKEVIKKARIKVEPNEYIWVNLGSGFEQNKSQCWYTKTKIVTTNRSIRKEINKFSSFHNIDSVIYAPITEKNSDYLLVNVTPNFTVKLIQNQFEGKYSEYSVGDIKPFRIIEINKIDENKKVYIKLKPIFNKEKVDMFLWNLLPSKINKSEVIIPNKFLNILNENDLNTKFFTNCKNDIFNLCKVLNNMYIEEYENKRVTTRQSSNYFHMEFDTKKRDKNNVPIHACFKKNKSDDNGKWILSSLGFSSAEREFEKYVYIENWSDLLDELSAIVLKGENWDLADENEKGKKYILKQYLRITYYKARLDDLIIESDEGYAIFDTGLVDKAYENVYCVLKKNNYVDDFYNRKWCFNFFAAWGQNAHGKTINGLFSKRPPTPKYIDKLEDIFYDTSIDLYCDYEHIIVDNLKRLPVDFLIRKLSYNTEISEVLVKYKSNPKNIQLFSKIKEYIQTDSDAFREIQFALDNAVETAKKYCKWNYKTAIPIYYPRTNGISLLLPLCLTNDANIADVALVIEKQPKSGNYQGQTILTLDMAYQDARQICRPNSEWLTLDNIKSNNNIDDEEM